MDEKLRMLDSRIQQSVLHSVLDPAGGGQGQNRPLLEQMCLGMDLVDKNQFSSSSQGHSGRLVEAIEPPTGYSRGFPLGDLGAASAGRTTF